jgi:isovaleryl-CoA dehydrogenase
VSIVDTFNPTPEHLSLRKTVRDFVEREVEPQAAETDRLEKFNVPLFRKLADLGLLGITVPKHYGGLGMDASAAVIVHEELATSDSGFTLAYLTHSMLFAENLARNGSEEQCRRFLPDACAGKIIGCMAMSEPGAGTDLMGMTTRARCENGQYILNGSKMWITNGVIGDGEMGDVFLIYARTSEHSVRGISLLLVEKGTPGFSLGRRIRSKLGVRGSTSTELLLQDCPVPEGNRVGPEGTAVLRMMRTLEIERLTMAAMGLGIAKRALEIMNRFATERRAFGQPIRTFGQIQRHLGESYAEFMAGRAYVYQTASMIDRGAGGVALDADGVKLYCSTMAKNVADRAIQVLGARGYIGENVVERLWRDAKLLEIGGGTLEAHQRNITRNLVRVGRIE